MEKALQTKFNRLAKIAAEMSKLEAEKKKLFIDLSMTIGPADLPQKVTTPSGTLSLSSVQTYEPINVLSAQSILGKKQFMLHCTISMTNFLKAGGDAALEKLKAIPGGGGNVASVTKYYRLISKKKA